MSIWEKLFTMITQTKVPQHQYLVFKEKIITLGDVSQAIQEFFPADTDPQYVRANLGHAWRYFIALKYIIEHGLYEGRIFEAGGGCLLT